MPLHFFTLKSDVARLAWQRPTQGSEWRTAVCIMSQEKKAQAKTGEEEEETNDYEASIMSYNTHWAPLESQEKQRLKQVLWLCQAVLI